MRSIDASEILFDELASSDHLSRPFLDVLLAFSKGVDRERDKEHTSKQTKEGERWQDKTPLSFRSGLEFESASDSDSVTAHSSLPEHTLRDHLRERKCLSLSLFCAIASPD